MVFRVILVKFFPYLSYAQSYVRLSICGGKYTQKQKYDPRLKSPWCLREELFSSSESLMAEQYYSLRQSLRHEYLVDFITKWLRLKIKVRRSLLFGRIGNVTSASSSKTPCRRPPSTDKLSQSSTHSVYHCGVNTWRISSPSGYD